MARIAAIIDECKKQGIGLRDQIAYVLATTQHETNNTFQPVREAYYLGDRAEAYRRTLNYYPYYGRGYVQLTWDRNYQTYADLLGKDLVLNPDLALQPDAALFVLVHGFKVGTFYGSGDYEIHQCIADRFREREAMHQRCGSGSGPSQRLQPNLPRRFLESRPDPSGGPRADTGRDTGAFVRALSSASLLALWSIVSAIHGRTLTPQCRQEGPSFDLWQGR